MIVARGQVNRMDLCGCGRAWGFRVRRRFCQQPPSPFTGISAFQCVGATRHPKQSSMRCQYFPNHDHKLVVRRRDGVGLQHPQWQPICKEHIVQCQMVISYKHVKSCLSTSDRAPAVVCGINTEIHIQLFNFQISKLAYAYRKNPENSKSGLMERAWVESNGNYQVHKFSDMSRHT